jgi:rhamnogalacturonan endolyase
MVDVSCKHIYASGDAHPVDIDIHYVLRQGNTGLYVYAILSHPASYPDLTIGEWRMVYSIATDPANTNNWLLENVYVDALRHWQAPTPLDLSQATTQGIKEIALLNTGLRKGQYECKYEYAPEYYKVGTYGWASDVHKIGEWIVLGNYEYFNDGPPKQDLGPASNGGGILLHFGRNHFNGSGTSAAAGQAWSKIYGPFFIYYNSNAAGGDACWADAQAQVAAEHSAWPYSWLTTASNYPQATARGAVTGKLIVSDPLKPGQTAASAWVGVTDAPAGTNWQFWSNGYEYWVQADANGNFTIPNVRPGTYTLSAYVTGEVGEYTQTNVTVTAGQTKALGNTTWTISHPGQSIAWEIGTPDRSAAEFADSATYYVPYEFETLYKKFPNPVEYTVGSSVPSRDFPYVQSALWQPDGSTVAWPWNIHFNLANVPSSGKATLVVAIASSNTAHLKVFVNGSTTPVGDLTPSVDGGNALLREVVHAKYCVENITIPVSSLRAGANTIKLLQSAANYSGNSIMYDYLRLEMPTVGFQPTVYQAENGVVSAGGVLNESTNAGFTGTGYANTANAVGASLQSNVTAPSAGTYTLDIRYANGSTADRPANLSVNGVIVQNNVSFAGTGAWTTWSDVVTTVNLVAGSNTITLAATTANGTANLDKLTLSQ